MRNIKLFKAINSAFFMVNKICFYSTGFAFNRLNRLRYYEKIFPKEVEIYLFTTDRYKGKESKSYQYTWEGLERTKIITVNYNWILPFTLREFCIENKIDRIVNLGNRKSFPLFLFSSLFTKTEYIPSLMGWVPSEMEMEKFDFGEIWQLIFFYFFSLFSLKVITNDYGIYKRYHIKRPPLSKIFISKSKVKFLPVTVNSQLFKPKNKIAARKKLSLPKNKKIAIFVGRTARCAEILAKLIEENKDILFLIIGRITDKSIPKLKSKNFIHFSKKSSKELVDYYNAADIHIALHDKKGAGLGLAAEESLSCGVPTIIPFTEVVESSQALFQIPLNAEKADQVLNEFFKKTKKERKKLSVIARDYAEKFYSGKRWENDYIKEYIY